MHAFQIGVEVDLVSEVSPGLLDLPQPPIPLALQPALFLQLPPRHFLLQDLEEEAELALAVHQRLLNRLLLALQSLQQLRLLGQSLLDGRQTKGEGFAFGCCFLRGAGSTSASMRQRCWAWVVRVHCTQMASPSFSQYSSSFLRWAGHSCCSTRLACASTISLMGNCSSVCASLTRWQRKHRTAASWQAAARHWWQKVCPQARRTRGRCVGGAWRQWTWQWGQASHSIIQIQIKACPFSPVPTHNLPRYWIAILSMKKEDERSKSAVDGQRAAEAEIGQLVAYLRRAPRFFQKQLLPAIVELRRQFEDNERLREWVEGVGEEERGEREGTMGLVHNYVRMLQLRVVGPMFVRAAERVESERAKPSNRKRQEVISRKQVIDKIDLLHPEYDVYFKMSKERVHPLPQYHSKTRFRDFYADPRFTVRLEEIAHFRSNQRLKGDIIFLSYHGHSITGSKVFAVANAKAIEVWGMESMAHPMPVLSTPADSDEPDKKKDEPQPKKEEPKPAEIPPSVKFSLNFKFLGHTEKVTSLSLSNDEYYLLSASADRQIKLWDLRLQMQLATYRGHNKTVWDVVFSPSGYYFLSGGADGYGLLWKTDEPHPKRLYRHGNDVYKVSFAKDPTFVITAGENGCVKVWHAEEANLVKSIDLAKPIINFTLGFSGSMIVTVESDGRISILDLLRGSEVNSFYFYEPEKKKQGKEGKEGQAVRKMLIHDVCLSQDERELSCVGARYVLVYSMDRLEMKVNNNIYTFFQNSPDADKVTKVAPKEVIYMGPDTNLTYCSYSYRNLLIVGGTTRN